MLFSARKLCLDMGQNNQYGTTSPSLMLRFWSSLLLLLLLLNMTNWSRVPYLRIPSPVPMKKKKDHTNRSLGRSATVVGKSRLFLPPPPTHYFTRATV